VTDGSRPRMTPVTLTVISVEAPAILNQRQSCTPNAASNRSVCSSKRGELWRDVTG
jgi:hypothetical protein